MLVLVITNIRIPDNRDIALVLGSTLFCSVALIITQLAIPEIILTGLMHTLAILILHLYMQNIRKSSDALTGVLNRINLTHSITRPAKSTGRLTVLPSVLHWRERERAALVEQAHSK